MTIWSSVFTKCEHTTNCFVNKLSTHDSNLILWIWHEIAYQIYKPRRQTCEHSFNLSFFFPLSFPLFNFRQQFLNTLPHTRWNFSASPYLTICILTQFSSPPTFFAHVPAKFSARHIFSSFASAIYSLIFNRLCLYSRTACLICLPRVHIQIKLTRLTMCARKTEYLASQHWLSFALSTRAEIQWLLMKTRHDPSAKLPSHFQFCDTMTFYKGRVVLYFGSYIS